MTDLSAAIAAAREAVQELDEFKHPELADAYLAHCIGTLRDLLAALDAAQPKHSTQDCYEHFLSYSGAADHPWLKYAYFHGADVGINRPKQAPPAAVEERGRDPGKPIAELMQQYESEGCDFSDMEWVRKASMRYVLTMPDSQVRCLLYALAKAPPAAVAAETWQSEPIAWQYRFAAPDGFTWSDWQPIHSEKAARHFVDMFGKAGTRAEWRSLKVLEWGGYAGEVSEADFVQAPPAAVVPEGFAALVDAADNAFDSAEGVAYVEFYRREPVEKLISACRSMIAAANKENNNG